MNREFVDEHTSACLRGDETYTDPKSGFSVFTRLSHLRRGYCCQSGCRHCPYGFQLSNTLTQGPVRSQFDLLSHLPHRFNEYPVELFELLMSRLQLNSTSRNLDIESGLFEMRHLFDRSTLKLLEANIDPLLVKLKNERIDFFRESSSKRKALEISEIEDDSIDVIFVGSVMFDFNPIKSKNEFQRILKSEGTLVVLWNQRVIDEGLMQAEDALLRQILGYPSIEQLESIRMRRLSYFLSEDRYNASFIENDKELDRNAFFQRKYFETSNLQNDPNCIKEIEICLQEIFSAFEEQGLVSYRCNTLVHCGPLRD